MNEDLTEIEFFAMMIFLARNLQHDFNVLLMLQYYITDPNAPSLRIPSLVVTHCGNFLTSTFGRGYPVVSIVVLLSSSIDTCAYLLLDKYLVIPGFIPLPIEVPHLDFVAPGNRCLRILKVLILLNTESPVLTIRLRLLKKRGFAKSIQGAQIKATTIRIMM
jgi:hypothetical protein